MLSEAAGRGQHSQARGHSISLHGPTLSRPISRLSFFGIHLLSRGSVYATFSLNSVTRRLQTICNLMREQASISDKSDTRQRKMY